MLTTKSKIDIHKLNNFSTQYANDIRNLIMQLGSTYNKLTNKDLRQIIKSEITSLIIAHDSEKDAIVGMGTISIYRIPYLKKAYLDDFVIDKAYQGQGIGSRLMAAILDEAKKAGASFIEFTSNPKRATANKFYQKQGFEKRNTNVYRLEF